MRGMILGFLVFAVGCSTAPVAGFLDWCKPSPVTSAGGVVTPLPLDAAPPPVVPGVTPIPAPVGPPPGVFDPTRLRKSDPATPPIPSNPPPPITTDPVPGFPRPDPVLLPPPAFPDGR